MLQNALAQAIGVPSNRIKETNGSSEPATARVIARLYWAGIANTRMNEMANLWGHVQFEARRRWREIDTPTGRIPALPPPGGIGPEPRMTPVPALGEHSAALLAELGYSEADIARLRQERVI